MITITIRQTVTESKVVKENQVVKETPSEILEDSYSGGTKRAAIVKEYAVVDVTKTSNVTTTLLEQNILDDSKFDLAAVLLAVNGL